ncbi:hypothetical protein QAD02_011334 [Eretmocerus hayati]|uniref:Uncharacterized protein n=1 Tax=Eretmocerus hayati TaxID=131215 RepID=A0ACC2NWF7_9HYME|nr:hypothetical protein QAD02_011334 [Eretmocerus hayati]
MDVLKSKIVSDLKTLSKDKKLNLNIIEEVDSDKPLHCKTHHLSDKIREKENKVLAEDVLDPTTNNDSCEEKKMDPEISDYKAQENSQYRVSHIMTMLTLYGCLPNAETCLTIGHKSVMYALQPIKAGTPLIHYSKSPTIYDSSKLFRQLKHQQLYQSICDCRACTENWPDCLHEGDGIDVPVTIYRPLKKFLCESKAIKREWETQMSHNNPSYPDLKLMNRARNCARKSWKFFPVPSFFMTICTRITVSIINFFYDPDKNMFSTS